MNKITTNFTPNLICVPVQDQVVEEHFDISVYGLKLWLKEPNKELYDNAKALIPLDYVHRNPWTALWQLDIDATILKKQTEYKSIFDDRLYNSIVPYYIITKEPRLYKEPSTLFYREMITDVEWMKNFVLSKNSVENQKNNRSTICFLGPGYTSFMLPSDGHNSIKQRALLLTNGDEIICNHYEWYNK